MRDELDNEIHTTSRRDSRLRRFGVPILAAATVVGLAAGGYALFGGNGREISPAGNRSTVSASPTARSTTPPTAGPQKSQHPTPNSPPTTKQTDPAQPSKSVPVSNPAQAYRSCIKLVKESPSWDGGAIKGLTGKLAIDNGKGTTVVVANGSDAYTCNIKPDNAVSNPRPLSSAVSPETFAVAHNVTRNVISNDPGDMVWGGGALPDGVTSVAYTFPDGARVPATTNDGFWAMQYFSPEAFTNGNYLELDPIKVTLDGPGGQREVTLSWGDHTCNQVSHGC